MTRKCDLCEVGDGLSGHTLSTYFLCRWAPAFPCSPGKSSLRGSLPDTRAALLKTAQVRRFPDTEKRLQPQGAWRGVKTVSTGILDGFWGTQGTRVENG